MAPGKTPPKKRSGPSDGVILRTLLAEKDAPVDLPPSAIASIFSAPLILSAPSAQQARSTYVAPPDLLTDLALLTPPTSLVQWVHSAQSAHLAPLAPLAPTASSAQLMPPLQLASLSSAPSNPLLSPLGAAPPSSPNYQPIVQELGNGSNLPLFIVAASRQRIVFLEQERVGLKEEMEKQKAEIEELKSGKSQDADRISRLEFENRMIKLRFLSKDQELEAGKVVLRQLQEWMKSLKLRYEGLQQGLENRETYWNVKMGQAASAYQELVNEVIGQSKRERLLAEQLNELTVQHNNSNPMFQLPLVPILMKDISIHTGILNRMNTDGVFLIDPGNGLKRQNNDGKRAGPTKSQKKSKRATSEPPKVP